MRVQCGYVVALEFVRKLDRAIRASDNFSNAGYGGWSAYTGCSDIDECAAGTHDCPVICVNNNGNVAGDGTAKHLSKIFAGGYECQDCPCETTSGKTCVFPFEWAG